jgi:hypothetical protein
MGEGRDSALSRQVITDEGDLSEVTHGSSPVQGSFRLPKSTCQTNFPAETRP